MIYGISICEPSIGITLNIYRDPETKQISADVDGGATVNLSTADVVALVQFFGDEE